MEFNTITEPKEPDPPEPPDEDEEDEEAYELELNFEFNDDDGETITLSRINEQIRVKNNGEDIGYWKDFNPKSRRFVAGGLNDFKNDGEGFVPRESVPDLQVFLKACQEASMQKRMTEGGSVSSIQYGRLLDWFDEKFPTSYISPSLAIAASPKGGQGLFATEDIANETLLFSIPREACITLNDILDDPECGRMFNSIIRKAGKGGFAISMAGFLAKEYAKYLEGEDVKFGPYLATLPWERDILGQEHVLFWSDEEVNEKLNGSIGYEEIMGLRQEVADASGPLNSVAGVPILKARGVFETEVNKPLIPFLDFTKPVIDKKDLTDKVPGLEKMVTGAFVIQLTRAFVDYFDKVLPDGDAEMLIPFADIANHDQNTNIIRTQSRSTGKVEIKARRDIKAGEEIFNRYRDANELQKNGVVKLPPHRWFTRFSFIPGYSREAVEVMMAEKNPLFFDTENATAREYLNSPDSEKEDENKEAIAAYGPFGLVVPKPQIPKEVRVQLPKFAKELQDKMPKMPK